MPQKTVSKKAQLRKKLAAKRVHCTDKAMKHAESTIGTHRSRKKRTGQLSHYTQFCGSRLTVIEQEGKPVVVFTDENGEPMEKSRAWLETIPMKALRSSKVVGEGTSFDEGGDKQKKTDYTISRGNAQFRISVRAGDVPTTLAENWKEHYGIALSDMQNEWCEQLRLGCIKIMEDSWALNIDGLDEPKDDARKAAKEYVKESKDEYKKLSTQKWIKLCAAAKKNDSELHQEIEEKAKEIYVKKARIICREMMDDNGDPLPLILSAAVRVYAIENYSESTYDKNRKGPTAKEIPCSEKSPEFMPKAIEAMAKLGDGTDGRLYKPITFCDASKRLNDPDYIIKRPLIEVDGKPYPNYWANPLTTNEDGEECDAFVSFGASVQIMQKTPQGAYGVKLTLPDRKILIFATTPRETRELTEYGEGVATGRSGSKHASKSSTAMAIENAMQRAIAREEFGESADSNTNKETKKRKRSNSSEEESKAKKSKVQQENNPEDNPEDQNEEDADMAVDNDAENDEDVQDEDVEEHIPATQPYPDDDENGEDDENDEDENEEDENEEDEE